MAWLSIGAPLPRRCRRRIQSLAQHTVPLTRLLQLFFFGVFSQRASAQANSDDTFGPENCISLSRSKSGSCMVTTACGSNNISNTEFAFVCFNPGTKVPHALHSFGRGGFAAEETFDTGVNCAQCTSVDTAFSAGSPLIRSALRALPEGWLSNKASEAGGPSIAPVSTTSSPARKKDAPDDAAVPGTGQVREMKTPQAAFYGPAACVATFLSPAGTCLIQTRCAKAELAGFNVGVTCLDQIGDYARYMFGVGVFDAEETFDTHLECEQCLGVSEDPVYRQVNGMLPKQIVDDVNSLKDEVQVLRTEISTILQGLPEDMFGLANATSDQAMAKSTSGSASGEGESARTSSSNGTDREPQIGTSNAAGEKNASARSAFDRNASEADSRESSDRSEEGGEVSGNGQSEGTAKSESESAGGAGSAQETSSASAGAANESSSSSSLEACSSFTSTDSCPSSRCTWIESNGCTEWELAPAPSLAAAPAAKAERIPHPRPKPATGGAKPARLELAAAARGPRPNEKVHLVDHPRSAPALAPAPVLAPTPAGLRTTSAGGVLFAKEASSGTLLGDADTATHSRISTVEDGEDTPVVLHHRNSDSHASAPTLKDLLMRFSS